MPVTISGSGPVMGLTTVNSLTLPTDSIQPGMVLIASQSFSAASSVSVNNCFSSTYDNYRIILTGNASADVSMYMRFRSAGSDNSTLNYAWQYIAATSTSVSAASSTGGSASSITAFYTSDGNSASIDVMNPNLAKPTGINTSVVYTYGTLQWRGYAALFTATTQFDGFTIYPSSGNMTGTLRVYGYRNS